MNLKCIIYSMNELATEKVPACTQHIITFPLPDSQHASADPSPSPRTHSSGASDADVNGSSGLKPTAGNAANFMCWNRWLASVSHSYHEVNLFYAAYCSSFPLSEGNSEEVQVGKISFTPSEVLGHGTAGTFVFRYSIDTTQHDTTAVS